MVYVVIGIFLFLIAAVFVALLLSGTFSHKDSRPPVNTPLPPDPYQVGRQEQPEERRVER